MPLTKKGLTLDMGLIGSPQERQQNMSINYNVGFTGSPFEKQRIQPIIGMNNNNISMFNTDDLFLNGTRTHRIMS